LWVTYQDLALVIIANKIQPYSNFIQITVQPIFFYSIYCTQFALQKLWY
jgi:hypothetical protein